MKLSTRIQVVPVVLMIVAVLLAWNPALGAEVTLVEDTVTSGSGTPFAPNCSAVPSNSGGNWPDWFPLITDNGSDPYADFRWSHNIGGVDLSSATRAEIVITAYDVDDGETHEVYINGSKIGEIPGGHNQWDSLEVALDPSLLNTGTNKVVIESSTDNTILRAAICRSRLVVYGEERVWELSIDPEERTVDPGEDITAKVSAAFSGACSGPVALDIDESTSEYIIDATYMDAGTFNGLEDPDSIYARLGQNELSTGDSDSSLEIKVGGNVPSGIYRIKVDGASNGDACGDDAQSVVLELIIGEVTVTLEKRQSKSDLTPGMTQLYTLRVVNENSPELTNLVITDKLDSRLEYVSDTSGAAHTVAGNVHTWAFATLAKDEAIEFQVRTRVKDFVRQGSSISNSFTVTSDQLPEEVVSNTVTATMGFVGAEPDDLKVTKRLIAGRPKIGAILTYRIEVENVGSGPVFGVRLSDDPPTGFKIPPGKTLRDGKAFADPVRRGGKYTWQLGPLAAGARTVITYQMAIGTNPDAGRSENCAEAVGRDGGDNKVSGSDCAIVKLGGGDVGWLGQITAVAFLDMDGDGEVDTAVDKPLSGVEFWLMGGEHAILKQTTDRDGVTVFAELKSGSYVLSLGLNKRTLDRRKYRFDDADHAKLVDLTEGEVGAKVLFLISSGPVDGFLKINVTVQRSRN